MIKFIRLFLFILLLLTSCATQKTQDRQQAVGKDFSINEKLIIYDYDLKDLETFDLDTFYALDFSAKSTPVKINNILKNNESLPAQFKTSVISKSIVLNQVDRFILKIRHQTGGQFVLPFLSNQQKVQLPLKLMYEKVLEKSNLKESNFLVKIPQTGKYIIHFLSFSPENKKFESSFYFGQEQTGVKSTHKDCASDLATNLRHCITSQCRVDMTDAFTPLDQPPQKIFYQYTIKPVQNTCQVVVESNIEDKKSCKIPIEFNPLIQDCGYPMKDPTFARQLNLLNKKFFASETPEDILQNASDLQKLWLNEYPISLMCSKELDFQLPDLDLLMKKYCQITPTDKKYASMIEWREELDSKIAIKQATLNFKSLTQTRENNTESHNEFMEQSDQNKKLAFACLSKNELTACTKLSEQFSKIGDYLHAGEISAHACKLGNGLACQKAGLSLTQAKKRDQARKYDLAGCKLKDSISCYNVACGYCIDNNPKLALEYFKKHLSLGAEDPMHIIFDPTIQCIRNTETFKQFVKKSLAP